MALIRGEINLTLDIIFGLLLGEIILRLGLVEKLMRIFLPILQRNNIPAVTGVALAVSTASSKTGAAIISSALASNSLTERAAVWSVLMLPLSSYLRRWPATFALSVSMAGKAGAFFALSLIFRSVARFFVAFVFLKREKFYGEAQPREFHAVKTSWKNFFRRLAKTLPLAWVFFALSYSLVPILNGAFSAMFAGRETLLPLAGWTVAAGSVAHVSAALALAGGGLASGELSNAQAAFALILGSGLGTATRILRQNAGYYFGLFPAKTARKMLLMNFFTIMPLIVVNVIIAGVMLMFA